MPSWFSRRPKAAQNAPPKGGKTEGETPAAPPAVLPSAEALAAVPEGAFVKCAKCQAILIAKDFERDKKVCEKCGHHHRLTATERIEWTADEGSFVERDAELSPADPLGFPEYGEKMAKGRKTSGRNDALVSGTATISGFPCVLLVADFGFMGGSMGSVFGEKFVRAADYAIAKKLPFVIFCASGGARMQEGLFSLMQMAKTSAAVAQLSEEKIPYIVVVTDPTTGGAWASFAAIGDVIFAEPGAYVAFAGTRVASQALAEKPPANYQTAEWQEEHGMIDRVVARKELPMTLARTLAFFGVGAPALPAAGAAKAERNGAAVSDVVSGRTSGEEAGA